MISAWIRVIRIRFLLASVISVSVGLAITWWATNDITIVDAILTMCGVLYPIIAYQSVEVVWSEIE